MKVKMLTGLSGVDFSVGAGEEYECSADEAERLIAAGFAEAVEAESVVDTVKSKGRKVAEKADALLSGKEQRG